MAQYLAVALFGTTKIALLMLCDGVIEKNFRLTWLAQ
jgi:hypothetical protein